MGLDVATLVTSGPGRCRGKAVAARWRATGGAGHIRHNERADWRFSPIERSGGWSDALVAVHPWQDAVAVASGISGEVSLAVAAGDPIGACILHAPVFAEVG